MTSTLASTLITNVKKLMFQSTSHMNYAKLALLSVLGIASTGRADIHLCDNIWTNRDCTAAQEARISEKPFREQNSAERLADRKKFMLNELDLRRSRAVREQKVSFEIESAREICSSGTSTLADCQKAVTEANEQLDKRIAAGAIRTEPTKKEEINPPQTVVTVIDNTFMDRGRRHHFDRDGDHDHDHRHDQHGSVGLNVELSGGNLSANLATNRSSSPSSARPTESRQSSRESTSRTPSTSSVSPGPNQGAAIGSSAR